MTRKPGRFILVLAGALVVTLWFLVAISGWGAVFWTLIGAFLGVGVLFLIAKLTGLE